MDSAGGRCHDNGRPSMDPVMLIKIPFIQYLYGIRSMRQTIREIEVNVAYRWSLGLDMMDPFPHFSTFGKSYTRRFKDTDLFERIFAHILGQCMEAGLVDTSQIFVDATHVKACANNKKMREQTVHDETLWYEDELKRESAQDRERHGKKPLKDKDRNDPPSGGSNDGDGIKTRKCSTSNPESGWFRKGEHKHVFVYAVETACDRNGWILGYPIPKRGIYYGARMISSQRGTVFKDQEYGKVKRVVSIWVCEDTAQYRSDCINRYSFTEECIRGDHHETREAYDLITVVVLRLGAKGEKSGDDAIRLLSKLFSVERTYGEKIAALSDEFKISVTKEMGREVLNVCNLSTGVYNKGYDSGILTGRQEGRQEGFLEALFGLVKDGILSVTDAAERAGMKDTDFEKAYKMFLL